MRKLLLATTNRGKVKEYRHLLAGLPYEIVSLTDEGITTEVEETGHTFEENARLKAVTLAEESGLLTLADDSGLEVDALDGEPGVRSARYAGEGASDADRIAYLLERMKDIPWSGRSAHFTCVIAVAEPDGRVRTCTGQCPGVIALEPKGENGFGYDPVFWLPDREETMAELPAAEKNRISHRAAAAIEARRILAEWP